MMAMSNSVQDVEVVGFVPNLMDRSRFPSNMMFISSASELDQIKPKIIFVDLDRCPDLQSFVRDGAKSIGFAPHVDSELAAKAFSLGYAEVLTRSIFFNRLVSLLG